MVIKCKKAVFLSNKANKQCFIYLLGPKLKTDGCTVQHAKADADVLILHTAVEVVTTTNIIVVVGNYTDLLLACKYKLM